jgi:hypothetical protein
MEFQWLFYAAQVRVKVRCARACGRFSLASNGERREEVGFPPSSTYKNTLQITYIKLP